MSEIINITGKLSVNAAEQTCDRLQTYFEGENIRNIVFSSPDNQIASLFDEYNMGYDFVGSEIGRGQFKLFIKLLEEKSNTKLYHVYGGPTLHTPVAAAISKVSNVPIISRFNGYTNPDNVIKDTLSTAIESWILKDNDAIIFNSHRQKEDTLNQYNLSSSENHYVVPPGVESKHFKPAPVEKTRLLREDLGVSDNTYIIGMVQTPRPVKQPKLSIDLINKLQNIFEDIQLVIVGDSNYISHYKQYARQLGISHAVNWVGHKPQNQLYKWYSLFDITTLTSSSESFGMSLTESYLCCTPCIAFDVGGMADQIVDGGTGYLIPPYDTEEFCSKIEKLLNDEKKREEFSQKGRDYVQKKFTLRQAGEQYQNIIEGLIHS